MRDLLTLGEVAARCRLSRETIRTYIASGALKALRLPGGYYRVPAEEVARILKPVEADR